IRVLRHGKNRTNLPDGQLPSIVLKIRITLNREVIHAVRMEEQNTLDNHYQLFRGNDTGFHSSIQLQSLDPAMAAGPGVTGKMQKAITLLTFQQMIYYGPLNICKVIGGDSFLLLYTFH